MSIVKMLMAGLFLHCATKVRSIEAIKCLINSGTEVNILQFRKSPLHRAADNNDLECLNLLIENGADVNATTIDKHTPLHRAALKGSVDVIMPLIKRGADVSMKSANGRTDLEFADEFGKYEIAEALRQALEVEGHKGGETS